MSIEFNSYSDYFPFDEFIYQGCSDELIENIKKAQSLMKENKFIFCIEISDSVGYFSDGKEECRVGYDIIKVYENSVYYKVYQKHSDEWGEVEFTEQIKDKL